MSWWGEGLAGVKPLPTWGKMLVLCGEPSQESWSLPGDGARATAGREHNTPAGSCQQKGCRQLLCAALGELEICGPDEAEGCGPVPGM